MQQQYKLFSWFPIGKQPAASPNPNVLQTWPQSSSHRPTQYKSWSSCALPPELITSKKKLLFKIFNENFTVWNI